MSSSIKDLELATNRHLDGIRRKGEREAAKIEKGHQDRKVDMKKSHDAELVDIRDEQLRQVSSETEKKDKVLQEMSKQLEQTRKTTDRNILEIKGEAERVRRTEFERLANERDKTKQEQDLFLEERSYTFGEKSKMINEEGRNQLEKVRDQKVSEITDREDFYRHKLATQREHYTTRINKEGTKYIEVKNDQDANFKKDRLAANARQQFEIGRLVDTHHKHLEGRDQTFRTGIKDQDLMFEKKYKESLGRHNENLTRLTDQNQEVVNKMKSTLTEKLNTATNKKDDPFYSFTELKPQVSYAEDSVIVKVAIPEHSKQDVQLTLNGKEVIVNYSRRHTDTRKEENSLNKVQKVESMSSRVKTDFFLDQKSVKSAYADGVMTYTVKKA